MNLFTTLWITLRIRAAARLRELAEDDRGVTTEHVIWIAFLAALALVVTALFGPKIMSAARSVSFQ